MPLSATYRLPHAIIGGVIALVLALFGIVQLASDALYARAAAPGAFAPHVPVAFGMRLYRVLDRIAPAAYVEDTLGNMALEQGDFEQAEHYAVRMPASPRRDELLARIALARGESVLAQEYFFAAPDVASMQALVAAIGRRDPRTAYEMETRFRDRLIELRTHPDAVADAYWMAGSLAVPLGRANDALANDETALRLAPLNMKYVLAAANQALTMHEYATAAAIYRHGLDVNPASGDAIAGLGLVALHEGRRDRAQAYAARARSVDPHAPMLSVLERALQ